ncbi:hypothetical protein DF182_18250 [Chitinophaga flava]|uniref:Uncharacterized protein n=1 Tax=Chitinophaga flava TaxID=2259036 RepID=A0A365XR66_9BACT|nr:hypothetical protein DF182_18250 [Chitinophaga flava]
MFVLSRGNAQTVTAGRVIVKDSISLNGHWIKGLTSDSTLADAGSNTLVTAQALKAYADAKKFTIKDGTGILRDSALTINPVTRELAMAPYTPGNIQTILQPFNDNKYGLGVFLLPGLNGGGILTDTIYLDITSSDGILTQVSKEPGYFISASYAKGYAPFEVKARLANSSKIGNYKLVALGWPDKDGMTAVNYNVSQLAYYKDTILYNLQNMRGTVCLTGYQWPTADSLPVDPATLTKVSVINHTRNACLEIKTGYQSILLPNQTAHFRFPRTGILVYNVNGYTLPEKGGYTLQALPDTVKLTVLKNGSTFENVELQGDPGSRLVSLDNSVTDLTIILEDK